MIKAVGTEWPYFGMIKKTGKHKGYVPLTSHKAEIEKLCQDGHFNRIQLDRPVVRIDGVSPKGETLSFVFTPAASAVKFGMKRLRLFSERKPKEMINEQFHLLSDPELVVIGKDATGQKRRFRFVTQLPVNFSGKHESLREGMSPYQKAMETIIDTKFRLDTVTDSLVRAIREFPIPSAKTIKHEVAFGSERNGKTHMPDIIKKAIKHLKGKGFWKTDRRLEQRIREIKNERNGLK